MVRRWLGSRPLGLFAALLAAALTVPSAGNGLGIDDHLHRARVLEGWTVADSARDLFSFADPDQPGRSQRAMESGELSWWAAPGLRWRFLRPLPLLIHHAEYKLLGRGGVVAMHLHNVLWLAAVVAAASVLFRRFLTPPWVAGLATILYAVDDGHGFTVGWIANRCTLMATFFAIVCLISHDRWRRDQWRPGAVAAPFALALTLACSEEGLAIFGFVIAHALILDGAPARRRWRAVAPHVAVLAIWMAVRHTMGYGVYGTGSYTDPLRDPAAYLTQTAQRIPILLHSLLGALPADLWEVYFVRHGLTWVMVALGVIFVALLAAGWWRLFRRHRMARFWAVGGALALIPVCGAHPTDRHLFVVGLAGAALVALYLGAWLDRRQPWTRGLLPKHGAAVLASFLVIVHGLVAPILLPVRARIPGAVSKGVARIDALLPDDSQLATQDLVLVNAPFKYLCNFASVVRRSNGGTSPRRWRCLGVSPDDVAVVRKDDRTLLARPAFGYLRYFEDTNVRARRIQFASGDRVTLPDFDIDVRRVTPDRRPAEVAFAFAVPLESPSLRWLVWQKGRYQSFTPPTVGALVNLPAESFGWSDLLEAPPPADRRD